MRWLIDATTARDFGALSDYAGILPALDSVLDRDECKALVTPELHELVTGRLKKTQLEIIESPPGFKRFAVLNTTIATSARRYRPHAALFCQLAPFTCAYPFVLRVTNGTLFDPAYEPCIRQLSLKTRLGFTLKQMAMDHFIQRAGGVICATHGMIDQLGRRQTNPCEGKIKASHFGPPRNSAMGFYHRYGGGRRLLTMHTRPHKNIELILAALAKPALRDWTLTVMADFSGTRGRYERYLIGEIRRLGLTGRVDTVGVFSDPDRLVQCMMAHDILVIPSRVETWSHPVIEGMAIGMPVIASDIACHREVAAKAVYYVPPDEPTAIIDAVQQIEKDQDELKAKIQLGLDIVGQLSWESHANKILDALRAAAGKN